MFEKVTEKTKNTDGPKFADPRTAAISPYLRGPRTVLSKLNRQRHCM